jgi:3-oxoacyl-[acyl-carrier-protein] synthase III
MTIGSTPIASGQAVRVDGARIAGLVSCVPPRRIDNEYFLEAFGDSVADTTKMTGVRTRYWVDEGVTASDLCTAAAVTLLDGLDWPRDSVDAVIFVSQTPDYRLPATAGVIQAKLGLRPAIIGLDINLGCSGYVYGLWLAMTLVASGAAKRALLVVGDTSSSLIDPADRATAMLFGDAGTATAVEAGDGQAHFILGTDGRGVDNLIVPSGAYRSAEHRSTNDPCKIFMDGGEIFNFTLKSVPKLVAETVQFAGLPMESYDAFLLHQANAFMVNHLAKKAKLPTDKVPMNIDRYGNTSSTTLPLLMSDDLAGRLAEKGMRLALFGFGVGYSWGGASLDVGPLACVKTISYDSSR